MGATQVVDFLLLRQAAEKKKSEQRGFSSFLQPLILMHLPLSLEF